MSMSHGQTAPRPARDRDGPGRAALRVLAHDLSGYQPADLPVGVAAAAAAYLGEPAPDALPAICACAWPLVSFGLNFVVQTARLARKSPGCLSSLRWLRPGFVRYETRLASAGRQSAFCALSSLMPGTLPTGSDETGALMIHCLDVEQLVAADLAVEEASLSSDARR